MQAFGGEENLQEKETCKTTAEWENIKRAFKSLNGRVWTGLICSALGLVASPGVHDNEQFGSKRCDEFITAEILWAPQVLCAMEF